MYQGQGQYQQNTQPQNTQHYEYNLSNAQMRHYFYKLPWIWPILFIIGILIFLFGLQISPLGGPFIALGVVLFFVAGIALLIYADRPTDEQYTRWIMERSQPLYKKALQRLHIDESQCERIVEVQGGLSSLLQLTKKFPEKEIAVKRRPNGYRHYSINVCTYIFLTKNDLAIYSGYINAFAQNERFEDADHYYYKDIVGVSTSGPIYTSLSGVSEKEIQRQGFFVRVSSGEAAGTDYATRVVLRDGENKVLEEGVDQVVARLLSLLSIHKLDSIEADKIAEDLR